MGMVSRISPVVVSIVLRVFSPSMVAKSLRPPAGAHRPWGSLPTLIVATTLRLPKSMTVRSSPRLLSTYKSILPLSLEYAAGIAAATNNAIPTVVNRTVIRMAYLVMARSRACRSFGSRLVDQCTPIGHSAGIGNRPWSGPSVSAPSDRSRAARRCWRGRAAPGGDIRRVQERLGLPECEPLAGPDADCLRALRTRDAGAQFRRQQLVVGRLPR